MHCMHMSALPSFYFWHILIIAMKFGYRRHGESLLQKSTVHCCDLKIIWQLPRSLLCHLWHSFLISLCFSCHFYYKLMLKFAVITSQNIEVVKEFDNNIFSTTRLLILNFVYINPSKYTLLLPPLFPREISIFVPSQKQGVSLRSDTVNPQHENLRSSY